MQELALRRAEPVHAGEDGSLDGVGDLDLDARQDGGAVHQGERPKLEEDLEQLLDEERVPLRPGRHEALQILRELRDAQEPPGQGDTVVGRQEIETDPGMAGPKRCPFDLLESGAVGQHQHQRDATQSFEQEPEEVERGAVRPMHVVEDQESGPGRGRQQELPHAREHLALSLLVRHPNGGGSPGQPEQRGHEQGGLVVDSQPGSPALQVVEVVRRPSEDPGQQIEKRPEGPLGTARDPDVQALVPDGELRQKPRLPDAWVPDQRGDVRVPLGRGGPEEVEERELLPPAHEGRLAP